MDWDELDRPSALSWRSTTQQSPCRSSSSSAKKQGLSRRTKRPDSSSDLPPHITHHNFFIDSHACSTSKPYSEVNINHPSDPEEINKHNRVIAWLEELRTTMDLPPPPDQPSHRTHTHSHSHSHSHNHSHGRSHSKSPHHYQHHHQAAPSAICKLPCQSCGTQSQTLSKHDRLSKSVRESSELISPIEVAPQPADWIGWKKSALSKSARHPKMAAPEAMVEEAAPPPLSNKNSRLSRSARHPEMAANDKLLLNGSLNKSPPKDIQPRMIYSASCRENGSSTQGRRDWFHGIQTHESSTKPKSSGNAVQQWFSQLWKSPRKSKNQPFDTIMEEPEQLKAGATIGDVINRKDLITETKVIVKSATKSASSGEDKIAQRPKSVPADRPPLPFRRPKESLGGTDHNREIMLSPPRRKKEMMASRFGNYQQDVQQEINNSPQSHSKEQPKASEENKPKRPGIQDLNEFLQRQRKSITTLQGSESTFKFSVIRSAHDLSVSSIICAICYAWYLENKMPENGEKQNPVPLINVARHNMWNIKQAAWLFDKCGLDTNALLFRTEIDMENLCLAGRCTILTVGQDILNTKAKVASSCTLLCEKYNNELPHLLDIGFLKMMLIAGLLLDTQNLDSNSVFCTARDCAALNLLLKGTGPRFRNGFYTDLRQKHENPEFEAMLCESYGQRPVNEAIPEEEEEEEEAEKVEMQGERMAKKLINKNMMLKLTINKANGAAMSQSPTTTDCSEPFTADLLDTSPSSIPESTCSNISTASKAGPLEDLTTKQDNLQLDLHGAMEGRKAGSESRFGRFFNGFLRSQYAIAA